MKKISYTKGFTIIETLVAVAILMISIAGPLTIANKGLTAAIFAHDQVTASYLAQDAMEYLKNVRDNNIKNSRIWLNKLSDCTKPTTCSVDTLNGDANSANDTLAAGIETCTIGSSCKLYLDSGGAGYSPVSTSGVVTKFSRYFSVTPTSGRSDEATLSVSVTWNNGTVSNTVTYDNEIFNIKR